MSLVFLSNYNTPAIISHSHCLYNFYGHKTISFCSMRSCSLTYLFSILFQITVESRFCNPEHPTNFFNCVVVAFVHLPHSVHLVRSQFFLPASLSASYPGCFQSGFCSLPDNSASAPKIWNINLPPLVVVSNPSFSEIKPTPLLSRSSTSWIRFLRDLPRRSSRQTTKQSFCRAYQGCVQTRSGSNSPGKLIAENLFTSCLFQGVRL